MPKKGSGIFNQPGTEESMFLLYFLLWVVFNGGFTLEIAIFGIVIAAVMFAFTCKFMNYSIAKEKQNIRKVFQAAAFIILLIKEITLANFAVIRLILTQKEEIVPELVTFRSNLRKPAARAFLANVITLTPGTITVTLEDDRFMVHCLDEGMAEGIEDLEFQKRLSRLENGGTKKAPGQSGNRRVEWKRSGK